MRALVVYESMFGNTRAVADEVGAGLATWCDVHVVPVSRVSAEQVTAADLVVVGAPTHLCGISGPMTRQGAVRQASDPARHVTLDPTAMDSGVREWLATLAEGQHFSAAVFDTRVAVSPLVTRRAGTRIARALRRHGCRLVGPPQSFLVTKQTRLVAGELDRARAWAVGLSQRLNALPQVSGKWQTS
jgi:hypothetical protein